MHAYRVSTFFVGVVYSFNCCNHLIWSDLNVFIHNKKQFFLCVFDCLPKNVYRPAACESSFCYIDDMRETTYKGALLLSVYKTSSAAWSLEISPLLFVRLLLGSVSFSRRTSSLHFRPGYPSISRPARREKEKGLLISSADVEPRRRSHPRCCCACVTSMLLAVSLPPSRGNDVVDRLISHI